MMHQANSRPNLLSDGTEGNTTMSQLVVFVQAVIKVGARAPAASITPCLLALGLLQHVLDVDKLRAAALAACQQSC
jgi:hypothetical protein